MQWLCALLVIFISILRTNAQYCVTPLGVRSQCKPLFQCPELASVFKQRQLSPDLKVFLRNSKCGYDGSTPIVCCGPLPSHIANRNSNQFSQPRPYAGEQVNKQRIDPVSREDSYLPQRSQCGIESNGDRIVGGNVTDLDEYPWMALLGYYTTKGTIRYECGGALINDRYVLTAAHCVVGAIEVEVGKLTTVRLGEYNTKTDRDCIRDDCADPLQELPVQATFPHSGYSDNRPNKGDDIGLVRLAQRARRTYFVQPICLISSNSPRLRVGNNVVVAGWGKTQNGRKSPVKLKVNVPIFDKNACINKYRSIQVQLENTQICAGGQLAEDSCRGDSGGPLMRWTGDGSWESIGIVSFGYGCGRQGWPGVYTSVAAYIDWIQNTMESSNRY